MAASTTTTTTTTTSTSTDDAEHFALEIRPGLSLAFSRYGERRGDNIPIILIHGGGQTRHSWAKTCAALAQRGFCAYCYDQKGHGDSYWDPDKNYTTLSMAFDLIAVLNHDEFVGMWSYAPVCVGASLGGLAIMTAIATGGPHPSAVILVDIAPRMEAKGVSRIVGFMQATQEGFKTIEEAVESIAAYVPHRDRQRNYSSVKKNLRQREDGTYVWHYDPEYLYHTANSYDSNDHKLREARQQLLMKMLAQNIGDTPVLLVRGKKSDLLSEEGVAEFTSYIPHSEFVDVNARHMVAGDNNDAFSEALIEFLTSGKRGILAHVIDSRPRL